MAEINKEGLVKVSEESSDARGLNLDPSKDFSPKPRVASVARGVGRDAFTELGNYNPETITFPQMFQMRRDPMIKFGLHFIKASMVNAIWKIESEDPQVAAFVENALREIWVSLMSQMLTSLDFGFAGMVKRYERKVPDWTYEHEFGQRQKVWPDEDIQAVVWNDFRVLPPNQIEPNFDEKSGDFIGIKWRGGESNLTTSASEGSPIPVEYSLWVTNEREDSFGNWYGYPRTGYAFRYWWSYWYRWLLGDRHFETDADPPLVITHPSGGFVDEDGNERDYGDIALAVGDALRNGATVALPSDVYTDEEGKPGTVAKWKADFLKGGENMPAFQNSFEYLDIMKLRAVLVPEQALVEGKGGTGARNVAAQHSANLFESLSILMEEIDATINKYVIPDLVAQNFIDPPSVRKVTTKFRSEDMTLAHEILTLIANSKPETLDMLDIRAMIRSLGLPMLKVVPQRELEEPPVEEPEVPENDGVSADADVDGPAVGDDAQASSPISEQED